VEIFQCALDRLGVAADAAVFVDDQAGFCAGGMAAGVRAVQIVRDGVGGVSGVGGVGGVVPAAGTTVVRSLAEVQALLSA
jgi:FMN phosphatase YigB (HAD superfamily)